MEKKKKRVLLFVYVLLNNMYRRHSKTFRQRRTKSKNYGPQGHWISHPAVSKAEKNIHWESILSRLLQEKWRWQHGFASSACLTKTMTPAFIDKGHGFFCLCSLPLCCSKQLTFGNVFWTKGRRGTWDYSNMSHLLYLSWLIPSCSVLSNLSFFLQPLILFRGETQGILFSVCSSLNQPATLSNDACSCST